MKKVSSEKVVQNIRRKTRRKFSSEEKIRIVLESFQSRMSASLNWLTVSTVSRQGHNFYSIAWDDYINAPTGGGGAGPTSQAKACFLFFKIARFFARTPYPIYPERRK